MDYGQIKNLKELEDLVKSWAMANDADLEAARVITSDGFLYNFLMCGQFSVAAKGCVVPDGPRELIKIQIEVALCNAMTTESEFLYHCLVFNRTIPFPIRLGINDPYLILCYYSDVNLMTKQGVMENLTHLIEGSIGLFNEIKRMHPSVQSYIELVKNEQVRNTH
jgi:hypothetical protein